jgi:hypothetical protein
MNMRVNVPVSQFGRHEDEKDPYSSRESNPVRQVRSQFLCYWATSAPFTSSFPHSKKHYFTTIKDKL